MPYRGKGRHPVLIAPYEALDGSLVGLLRIYLSPSGSKLAVDEPKLSFGHVKGAAIRLGEPTSDELIICEGLEDGLTLYQELTKPTPVWVAGGTSLLPSIAVPDWVQRLTIAADNDAAGERAARRAVDAFDVGGRVVRVMRPEPQFKDFNDQLRNIKFKDTDHV
jgi:DNA primase